MILWKFSFIVTLILNNCESTLGDIVITIKSEEGAPRKYEFTVQSSQSAEKPHVDDDVSPHKPLTVYFPPPTISSSTTSTSKPKTYPSTKLKQPPVHYKLPPLVKNVRPKYRGKGIKTRPKKPKLNFTRSRPRSRVRGKRKQTKRRPSLFENIVRRYRG